MPKSLFNFYGTELNVDDNPITTSFYKWADRIKMFTIDNSIVVTNPSNGGWIIFDNEEKEFLNIQNELPQNNVSEFLFKKGICSKNGKVLMPNAENCNSDKMYFFELAVTTSCNLKCTYCFADASPSKGAFSSKEIGKLFIDRIAEYVLESRIYDPIIIEFTGGEPLLNFSLIRYVVEYAKDTYGDLLNLEYCFQTNLTLLTSDMIRFFRENQVGVGVSLDGFKTIQDSQRPFINGDGSYDKVSDSLIKLNQEYPENSGGIITVISN